jgi:hypothetical protein
MLYLTSIRTTLLISALLTAPLALAQHDQHTDHGAHAQHSASQQTQTMDHSKHAMETGITSAQPTEAGQDAFAAIQEIVAIQRRQTSPKSEGWVSPGSWCRAIITSRTT